jgi:hypothetical protein
VKLYLKRKKKKSEKKMAGGRHHEQTLGGNLGGFLAGWGDRDTADKYPKKAW